MADVQAKAEFDDDLQINQDFQADAQGFNPGAEIWREPIDEVDEEQLL